MNRFSMAYSNRTQRKATAAWSRLRNCVRNASTGAIAPSFCDLKSASSVDTMRFSPQPDLKTEIRMDTTAAQQPGVENAERPELDREDGCTLARRSSADGGR